MKKILTITVLGTLLGAASVQAQTADIYITGSTAFRANVYNSIKALYSTLAAENATTNNSAGTPVYAGPSSGNSRWTMSGQMNSLFGSRTIIVHANFTGSVQGIHGLYDQTDKSVYLKNATVADLTFVTNTASCAFSDVDSSSTAYPLNASAFYEKYVAVQPFTYTRSLNAPTTITNVTIQQMQTIMPNGQLPLSYVTGKPADAASPITLVNRSLDSGTRVAAYLDAFVSGSPQVYYYDTTNNVYSLATYNLGPALYGYGYVGGADVKNVLNINNANNVAIAYLGLSDAKGVNGGQNILSYNGFYPSSDIKTGSSVPAAPLFDNVRNGQYSYWAYEVFAWPKTVSAGDQTIISADLTKFCRTVAGYDIATGNTFIPNQTGSIDADILSLATKVAVRLGDMNVSRQSVGGAIAP